MKRLTLLSTLILGLSMNVYANANQEQNSNEVAKNMNDQSAHALQIAEASQAGQDVNNALRLKFISRRASQNPAVKNKDKYKADDEWVGATHVDERESKASKRLNRQFRSKRPHINYQFD
jgi:hypothetical protein